jgi:uncharacterized protein YbjT (DUF2867 family)
VLSYLSLAAESDDTAGAELQIGGPDILSYGEMLDEMTRVLGKRPRRKRRSGGQNGGVTALRSVEG